MFMHAVSQSNGTSQEVRAVLLSTFKDLQKEIQFLSTSEYNDSVVNFRALRTLCNITYVHMPVKGKSVFT